MLATWKNAISSQSIFHADSFPFPWTEYTFLITTLILIFMSVVITWDRNIHMKNPRLLACASRFQIPFCSQNDSIRHSKFVANISSSWLVTTILAMQIQPLVKFQNLYSRSFRVIYISGAFSVKEWYDTTFWRINLIWILFRFSVPTAQQTYFRLHYKYQLVRTVEGNKIFC